MPPCYPTKRMRRIKDEVCRVSVIPPIREGLRDKLRHNTQNSPVFKHPTQALELAGRAGKMLGDLAACDEIIGVIQDIAHRKEVRVVRSALNSTFTREHLN